MAQESRVYYQDERLAKFLCGRLVVIYPVTDIGRARTFYEQTLGLKVGSHRNRGDKRWIEYDLPAVRGSSSSKAERLAVGVAEETTRRTRAGESRTVMTG
jgi:catechol 2,3-dioxygenase-like lactoylglutathione lyase family enzyme